MALGPNGVTPARAADEYLGSIHLPPTPDETSDEAELEELNEKIHQLEVESVASMSTQDSSSSSAPSYSPDNLFGNTAGGGYAAGQEELRKFHANLEARLHPFWTSSLGSRTVHISVYASDPEQTDFFKSPPIGSTASDEDYAHQRRPVASASIVTSADGSFHKKIHIPWDNLCIHPAALHIAFGDPGHEFALYVVADLMPPPSRPPSPNTQVSYAVRNPPPRQPRIYVPTATSRLNIPLTHAPVRLISDIDDTVKMSGVLSGARAVFHNVFVKDLSENVIPGMGQWYTSMWQRGVRFHYVVRLFLLSSCEFNLINIPSQMDPSSCCLSSTSSFSSRSYPQGQLS